MDDSVRWIYLSNRIDALEGRVAVLEAGHAEAPVRPASPPPPVVQRPAPPPPEVPAAPPVVAPPPPPAPVPPLPDVFRPPFTPPAEPVHRTSEEWEALI